MNFVGVVADLIFIMIGLLFLILFLSIFLNILSNLYNIIYKIIKKIYKCYKRFHSIIPREDEINQNNDNIINLDPGEITYMEKKEEDDYIIIKNPYNHALSIGSISKRLPI